MARRAKGLTVKTIETLPVGYHGDGGGLYLQVTSPYARSWVFRYQRNGKRRDMGLGPVHLIGLAEARRRAQDYRRMLFDGYDPLEVKQSRQAAAAVEAAKTITFEQAAKTYIAAHSAGWRSPKSIQQWESSLRDYAYPVFGALPVAAIDTGLVMRVLEPFWAKKPETAGRVRGRMESILGWATTSGYRQGDNPARWRGHLENLLPKKSKVKPIAHHAALPYGEIATFMAELRQQEGVVARALEFLILTATRTGEVIGARWNEINLAERMWVIPAARMKGHKEHRLPLSDASLAIVEKMAAIRQSEFVFPGGKANRPIGNTAAFLKLLRRMNRGDDTTAHGFRSTFRDWCAERSNFPNEVCEMALAHAAGSAVERAYRRGDLMEKRRALAQEWARFCTMPTTAGAVVPIRRA
jgi:integrase